MGGHTVIQRRSALYYGTVVHRRLKPVEHRLAYRVYYLLLDLDELAELHRELRTFSWNRSNLSSVHDRDYGRGDGQSLRGYVEAQLASAGIDLGGGAIRLLTMPRVLGYVFNPLSIYFCHDRAGRLAALLYEVNNTFGERHSYLAAVDPGAGAVAVHGGEKQFYVSPFIDMATSYRFRVRVPDDGLAVTIEQRDSAGPLLVASLTGRRAPLTDRSLLQAFATHPLLTLKVIGGIHWEALRLWRKGLRPRSRPLPPVEPVTVMATAALE